MFGINLDGLKDEVLAKNNLTGIDKVNADNWGSFLNNKLNPNKTVESISVSNSVTSFDSISGGINFKDPKILAVGAVIAFFILRK